MLNDPAGKDLNKKLTIWKKLLFLKSNNVILYLNSNLLLSFVVLLVLVCCVVGIFLLGDISGSEFPPNANEEEDVKTVVDNNSEVQANHAGLNIEFRKRATYYEIPIVTIVDNENVNDILDFIGCIHRYCPDCPITFYYSGSFVGSMKLNQYKNVVTVDLVSNILSNIDPYRTHFLIPLVIKHAMQTYHKVVYLDNKYCLNGYPEKLDESLKVNGYLLVPADEYYFEEDVLSEVIGFTAETETNNIGTESILNDLLSANLCEELKPCVIGNKISIPSNYDVKYTMFSDLQLLERSYDDQFSKQELECTGKVGELKESEGIMEFTQVVNYYEVGKTQLDETKLTFLTFELETLSIGELYSSFLNLKYDFVKVSKELTMQMELLYLTDDDWGQLHASHWIQSSKLVTSWIVESDGSKKIDVSSVLENVLKNSNSKKLTFMLRTSSINNLRISLCSNSEHINLEVEMSFRGNGIPFLKKKR